MSACKDPKEKPNKASCVRVGSGGMACGMKLTTARRRAAELPVDWPASQPASSNNRAVTFFILWETNSVCTSTKTYGKSY
jgi:hypothetical protein